METIPSDFVESLDYVSPRTQIPH